MRVFILARTESEIIDQIYPALADAGVRIVGYATSTDGLDEQLEIAQPDVILVRMTVCHAGAETAFLESLAPYLLIVLLPSGRSALEQSLRSMRHVETVAVEPADYAQLLGAFSDKPQTSAPEDEGRPSPATIAENIRGPASNEPMATRDSSDRVSPHTVAPARRASLSRPDRAKKARVIAFSSGMLGGTGKSTLAGTLAWLVAHEGQASAILLAFDTPPAVVTHYRLARWPDVALFLEGGEFFERTLQRRNALTVAITPGDTVTYERIGALTPEQPGAALHAIAEAAARFDLVIVDLPPDSTGWAIHPLLEADDVVIVVRPTVADQVGVVQTVQFLQALHHGRETQAHLILNDCTSRDITPEAFLAGVGQLRASPPVIGAVPHNRAVRLAQNEGVPLPLADGCDDVVAEMRRLAGRLGLELRKEEVTQATRTASTLATKPRLSRRLSPRLPAVRIRLTD
jgi:Flp pilus assembly CpaE family ATPase